MQIIRSACPVIHKTLLLIRHENRNQADYDKIGNKYHRESDLDKIHEFVVGPSGCKHVLRSRKRRCIGSCARQGNDHSDRVDADADGFRYRDSDWHKQQDCCGIRHKLG